MSLKEVESAERLEHVTSDEALKRLYRYWAERRGAKRYPSRDDIDPLDFGYALGRVSLVDVLENPRRYHYRLVSTSLTAGLGYEMTGKFMDEIPEPEVRHHTWQLYEAAVERRIPLHFRGEPMLDGRRWKSEALVLPLSSDQQAVDMLMIYRTAESSGPPRITPVREEANVEFIDGVDEPLLNELVAYWEAKRGGRMAPRRSDIDPIELKAHLPQLLLLDVLQAGVDFRYRLIGTAIVQGMGHDSTGRRVSEVFADHPALLKSVLERFRHVVVKQVPIFTRGRTLWVPDREHRRYVAVGMPLSEDGAHVNMILYEMILLKG